MDIKENYVSFEMAISLRKKGFDSRCFAVYDMKGNIIHNSYFKIDYTKQVYAPTLQMARAFLRKLGIEIFINKANEVSKFDSNRILRAFYFFDIGNSQGVYKENWNKIDPLKNDYESYEEAEKAAINQVLENWDWLMKETSSCIQNLKKNNKREEELIKIQEKEERKKNGE